MERKSYQTDLTDEQWKIIEQLIPPPKPGGRALREVKRTARKTDIREVINAIFYLLRAGCAWRLLPHDFPPWQTVYTSERQWKKDGTWKAIHDTLHENLRERDGRESEPSAAILDSQSVKTTEKGGLKDTMLTNTSRGASDISWWTLWV